MEVTLKYNSKSWDGRGKYLGNGSLLQLYIKQIRVALFLNTLSLGVSSTLLLHNFVVSAGSVHRQTTVD